MQLDATPYESMALTAAEALVTEQWDAALSAYSKVHVFLLIFWIACNHRAKRKHDRLD